MRPLIIDSIWDQIQAILPPEKPRNVRFSGRKPMDRRRLITGIALVINTGVPWKKLSPQLGCGSHATCRSYWNALRKAGTWDRIHELLHLGSQDNGGLEWRESNDVPSSSQKLAIPFVVHDATWKKIESVLPPQRRTCGSGRKRLGHRKVLLGILIVLSNGIPWEALPGKLGCGHGATCLNYARAWQKKGIWQEVIQILINEFPGAKNIDWRRVALEPRCAGTAD
jgi:transposase